MHYVYVLHGSKQFYTGYSSDLKRRLIEHNNDLSKSTKNRGPWRLIYYEACRSATDALIRERYLKTAWGKRYLKNRLKHNL